MDDVAGAVWREQQGRHQGGSISGSAPRAHRRSGLTVITPRACGSARTAASHRRAVKVWDQREFRDLDDGVELGTRNIKLALRRLRRFARQGAATELDMPGTIRATAHNAGSLDLKMVPERHNAVKVLLFLDVGGSMDDHIRASEELFSAARSRVQAHGVLLLSTTVPYERVWQHNRRRRDETIPTEEVIRTYGPDYRAIFVGDATMSPYEIAAPGGSVEHWNDESGAAWMARLLGQWRRSAWLNPVPRAGWDFTHSIGMMRQLMEDRMYPLTPGGLDEMIRELSR